MAKKTFTFLGNDAKAIGSVVTKAVNAAKTTGPLIHNALMQTCALAMDPSRGGTGSGDITLLERLLVGLKEANYPMTGIRSWVIGNFPITLAANKEATSGFTISLRKASDDKFVAPDFENANANPFWTYEPERTAAAVDPASFLETPERAAKQLSALIDNTAVGEDGTLGPIDMTKRFLKGDRARLQSAIDFVEALRAVNKPKLPALEGETKRSNVVVLAVPNADTPREAPQPVAA